MVVKIKLLGPRSRFSPKLPRNGRMQLPKGIILRELVTRLELSDEYAKLIVVNGQKVGMNTTLYDDDEILLFPMLGGG